MSEAVLKDFGVEPIGMWLAERVWEPHLPKVLHEAGLRRPALERALGSGEVYCVNVVLDPGAYRRTGQVSMAI